MIRKITIAFFALLFSVSCSYKKQLTASKIVLSKYYADSMILQASPVVHIAGRSEPEAVLAVKIDTYLKMAKANKFGEWYVNFPEIINDDPFRLTVEGKDTVINIEHVQAGRLIVLAGNAGRSYFAAETDSCNSDTLPHLGKKIRVFCPEKSVSLKPKSLFEKGKWHTAEEHVWEKQHCSDIALINQIVPNAGEATGIIDLTFAGTSLDAWLPENSAIIHHDSTLPEFGPDTILLYNKKMMEESRLQLKSEHKGIRSGATRIWYNDDNWSNTSLPVNISEKGNIMTNRIVYLRKLITINTKYLTGNFTIQLGIIHGNTEYYFNQKKIDPQVTGNGSVILHIPQADMMIWFNQLALRMVCADEKTGIYGNDFRCLNADSSYNKSIAEGWKYNFTLEDEFPSYLPVEKYPTLVYNSFLAPLQNISFDAFYWFDEALTCEDSVNTITDKTCEIFHLFPKEVKKYMLISPIARLDSLICGDAVSGPFGKQQLEMKDCNIEFMDIY